MASTGVCSQDGVPQTFESWPGLAAGILWTAHRLVGMLARGSISTISDTCDLALLGR